MVLHVYALLSFIAFVFFPTLVLSEEPPAKTDPMAWSQPKAPPKAREVLKGDAFETRLKLVTEMDRIEEQYKSAMPQKQCLSITDINPDSQAYKDGLGSGDVLLKVDGQPIFTYEELRDAWNKETPHEYTVISRRAGYAVREITVKTQADFRFATTGFYPMSLAHDYGEWPHDPRWNDFVAPAERLYMYSPELAETYLYKAELAGYPDCPAKNALLSKVFMLQGRYLDAMNSAWFCVKEKPDWRGSLITFFEAATAEFKLEQAAQTATDFKLIKKQEDLDKLVKCASTWAAIPAVDRITATPLETARESAHKSWLLRTERPKDFLVKQPYFDMLLTGCEFSRFAQSGHYQNLCLPLPRLTSNNFYFKAEFEYTRPVPEESEYLPLFELGFYDRDADTAGGIEHTFQKPGLLGIRFLRHTPPGRGLQRFALAFQHPFIPFCHDFEFEERTRVATSNEWAQHRWTQHTIEIAVVGQRAEVQLDGKRVFYGPTLSETRNWGLAIKLVGMAYSLHSMEAWELLPESDYKNVIKSEVNTAYARKFTALHEAIRFNFPLKDIQSLLDLGADPNLKIDSGETALHFSIRMQRPDVVNLRLNRGMKADPLINLALGHTDEFKAAVARDPAILRDFQPWSPMHSAVASGDLKFTKELAEEGAELERTDSFLGEAAIVWAARRNDLPMAKLLIELGARTNVYSLSGREAVDVPANNPEMLALFKTAENMPRRIPFGVKDHPFQPAVPAKGTKPIKPAEDF